MTYIHGSDWKKMSDEQKRSVWKFNKSITQSITPSKKLEAWDKQRAGAELISQKANINIVTCGECGDVLLHSKEASEIECPHCGFTSEPCDFPDLFHQRNIEDFK